MLPSSASSFSLILRAAASEISDKEKKELTAISNTMTSKLFNIKFPLVYRLVIFGLGSISVMHDAH